jgi:hypothetical protein
MKRHSDAISGRFRGHRVTTTRSHFAFRIDMWTADGESIVEHMADVEDLTVALATYQAACKRWPGAAITLRQGGHIIEDNQRSRLGTLFSFPWSDKGREGGR